MEEEVDKLAHLLDADMKVNRELERLDDVKTLTEIIQHYRKNVPDPPRLPSPSSSS